MVIDFTLQELMEYLDSYSVDEIQILYQQRTFDERWKKLLHPYIANRMREIILFRVG